jgi:hypothetical protein
LITPKSYVGRLKMMKEKKVKIQLIKDKEKMNEIIVGIRRKWKHHTDESNDYFQYFLHHFMMMKFNMIVLFALPLLVIVFMYQNKVKKIKF